MKLLLLLLLALWVAWLWSRRRGPADHPAAPPPAGPVDMVACAVCGVHVPRSDAVPGPGASLYCSTQHRQLAGH